MTVTPPTVNTFCRTLPGQPLIWDPSRLGPEMVCKRKHYLQTVRGLRKNGTPSVHLEWGAAYHDCTEMFDNLITNGWTRERATEAALCLAWNLSWNVEENIPRWTTHLNLVRCTSPAIREHKRKPGVMVKNTERCRNARHPCPEHAADWVEINCRGIEFCGNCGLWVERSEAFVPVHPKKTRLTLLRAVLLYADTLGTLEPYRFEDGTSGCEIQFRIPLPIDSPDPCPECSSDFVIRKDCHICHGSKHIPYELLVNLDSLVTWEGEGPFIRERKTTGRSELNEHYWAGFMMNPQIDSYDLVGNVVFDPTKARPLGLLLESLRVGTKDADISRLPIHIPAERRAEWLGELCGYIKDSESRAKLVQHGGMEPEVAYPRNITACIGAFGRCQFWDICHAPHSDREGIIEKGYHFEPWDPISCSTLVSVEEEG